MTIGTQLSDYNIDDVMSDIIEDHDPILIPNQRKIHCKKCGNTKSISHISKESITVTLQNLSNTPCERNIGNEMYVGSHTVGISEHGEKFDIYCNQCDRGTTVTVDTIDGVMQSFQNVPCKKHPMKNDVFELFSNRNTVSPSLNDYSILNWNVRYRKGKNQIKHPNFQYTIYIEQENGKITLKLHESPQEKSDIVDTIQIKIDNSDESANSAESLLQFLAVTDTLTAGEMKNIHDTYESIHQTKHQNWVEEAYNTAREKFESEYDVDVNEFTNIFGIDMQKREILRRCVGGDDYRNVDVDEFAIQMLGVEYSHPGLIKFIANESDWNPKIE